MIYLITYQLKSKRTYEGLYEAIKAYGAWWHYLERVWLVKTSTSPKLVYQTLRKHMDPNDSLFIIEVNTGTGHYFGFLNGKAWEWIRRNRE